MHEVEVEIVETQVGERLAARGDDVLFGVLVVPQLRGDPDLLALDPAADDLLKRSADEVLVAVNRRAVEVPIADLGRACEPLRRPLSARRCRSRTSPARSPASSRRCANVSAESPPGRRPSPRSRRSVLMSVSRLRSYCRSRPTPIAPRGPALISSSPSRRPLRLAQSPQGATRRIPRLRVADSLACGAPCALFSQFERLNVSGF